MHLQDWEPVILNGPAGTKATMRLLKNRIQCLQALLERCNNKELHFTPQTIIVDGKRRYTQALSSGTWMQSKWVGHSQSQLQ